MSARARRKRARKRERRENEQRVQRQVQGRDDREVIRIRCRFYKPGACDYPDGTPCVHGVDHEAYLTEELGPTDYCSGECTARHIQTWCTRVT